MQSVNYDYILQEKETTSVVKDLVREVKSKGQHSVGEWIKKLATGDIEFLSLSSACVVDDPRFEFISGSGNNSPFHRGALSPMPASKEQLRTVIVLVDVLAAAEGLEPAFFPSPIAKKRIILLDRYLSVEMIKRKGIPLKLTYSKFTLNEDVGDVLTDKSIVEIDGESRQQMKETLLKALKNMGPLGNDFPTEEGDGYEDFMITPKGEASVTIFKIDSLTGKREEMSENDLPDDLKERLGSIKKMLAAEAGADKGTATDKKNEELHKAIPDNIQTNTTNIGRWDKIKSFFSGKK